MAGELSENYTLEIFRVGRKEEKQLLGWKDFFCNFFLLTPEI